MTAPTPPIYVHSIETTVDAYPLVCVYSFGYTVGASPLCVSCIMYHESCITHDVKKYDIIKYDVMKYDVMKYDVMRYDVMRYDVMKYDVMKHDVMKHDVMKMKETSF